MRKVTVTLTAQTILQLDSGTHDAVRDGGNLYILLQQEDSFQDTTPTKEVLKSIPQVKEVVEVVDDTAPSAKTKSVKATKVVEKPAAKEVVKKVVEQEDEEEYLEIPESEWIHLKEGDLVLAKLSMEGDDGDKMWQAEVVGMKRPKGSKEDKLHVTFIEDGTEDYLREDDKLYEFQEGM